MSDPTDFTAFDDDGDLFGEEENDEPFSGSDDAVSLRRRLKAWEQDGDPTGVLDPEAPAEAERLWRQTALIEAVQMTFAASIGRLHWHRYLLLDEPDDDQDWVSAGFLTSVVRERTPQLLPGLVAPLLKAAESTNPSTHPQRAAKIAFALLDQGLVEDARILDRVIALLRPSAEIAAGAPEWQISAVNNLGNALGARHERFHDPADLDEAIEVLRRAAGVSDDSDTYRPAFLGNLCAHLCLRFERNGAPADLDEAVAAGSAAVALLPDGHPWKRGVEANLGQARRFMSMVQSGPDPLGLIAGELGESGLRSLRTHTESPDPRRLDRSIHLLRMATTTVSAAPDPEHLDGLAAALSMRYRHQRQQADLDEALAVFDRAFALAAPDDPAQATRLQNYALAVLLRHSATAQPEDLDLAIRLLRRTADLSPSSLRAWTNLGAALLSRYRLTNSADDLAEAITCGRRSLGPGFEAAPAADRATHLAGLSDALYERFQRGGADDFDEALALARAAVETSPTREAHLVDSLAHMLVRRFGRKSAVEDLDEAIALTRELADVAGPDAAARITQLCQFQLVRHGLTRARQDLDEAVAAGERALARLRPDSREGGTVLALLSMAYRTRSENDNSDTARALALGRAAVEALEGDPMQETAQLALSTALFARYQQTSDLAPLDEAVALMRSVIEEAPDWNAGRAHNLAIALRTRFRHTAQPADLDEAVRLGRLAVRPSAADHDTAQRRWALGVTLRTRYDHEADRRDADEAISLWRQASGDPTAPVLTRVVAARDRARTVAVLDGWGPALADYREAVELLQLLAWRGMDRRSGEEALSRVAGLASEAAAAALAAGRPEEAVELLESGRTMLWSQLLDNRSDLRAIRAQNPELARELEAVRTAIDAVDSPVTSDITAAMTGGIPDLTQVTPRVTDSGQRYALHTRWNALVERVRGLPGLAGFLRPTPLADLLPPPGTGPVVIINVSSLRCDALIVDSSGVRCLPLERLSSNDTDAAVARYSAAFLAHERQRTAASWLRKEAAVEETLAWLWDAVASPVLAFLGHEPMAEGENWPRLWWYPTSSLHLLPLAAAGRHEEPGQSVLDRVVSSTTPALRALAAARSAAAHDPERPLLVVAMPETAGRPALALPNVARERDHIRSLLRPHNLEILEGADATRASVYRALGRCASIHFSCHGQANTSQPSRSGVVLDDGVLSVTDIAAAASGGELAVLSACRTAATGPSNPDEAVHLASTLHYSGWRHVVATLNSVGDDDAADVTCAFYSHLVAGHRLRPADAARALHDVLRAQRARHPDQPGRWAPFLHLGP